MNNNSGFLCEYPDSTETYLEPYKEYRLYKKIEDADDGVIFQITPKNEMQGVDCSTPCTVDEEGNKISKCTNKQQVSPSYYDICFVSGKGKPAKKTKLQILSNKKKCRIDNKIYSPDFKDVHSEPVKSITQRLDKTIAFLSTMYSFRLLEKEFGPTYKTISQVFNKAIEPYKKLDNLPYELPAQLYITDICYGSKKRKKAICIFDVDNSYLLDMIDASRDNFSIDELRQVIVKPENYRNAKKILISISPGTYLEQLIDRGGLQGKNGVEVHPFYNAEFRKYSDDFLNTVCKQLKQWDRNGSRYFSKLNDLLDFGEYLSETPLIYKKLLASSIDEINDEELFKAYRFITDIIDRYVAICNSTSLDDLRGRLRNCLEFVKNKNPLDYCDTSIIYSYLEITSNYIEHNYEHFFKHFEITFSKEEIARLNKFDEIARKITKNNKGISFDHIRTKLLFYNQIVLNYQNNKDGLSHLDKHVFFLTPHIQIKMYALYYLTSDSIITYNPQGPRKYLPLQCLNHLLDKGILDMKSETSFGICDIEERIAECEHLRSLASEYFSDMEMYEYFGRCFETCIFGGPCIEKHTETIEYINSKIKLKKDGTI